MFGYLNLLIGNFNIVPFITVAFLDSSGWIGTDPYFVWILFLILCIYFWICIFSIAVRFGLDNIYRTLIPVQNFFVLCELGGLSWSYSILFFIPIINIVLLTYIFMIISKERGISRWFGLLVIAPIINIYLISILAFKKDVPIS